LDFERFDATLRGYLQTRVSAISTWLRDTMLASAEENPALFAHVPQSRVLDPFVCMEVRVFNPFVAPFRTFHPGAAFAPNPNSFRGATADFDAKDESLQDQVAAIEARDEDALRRPRTTVRFVRLSSREAEPETTPTLALLTVASDELGRAALALKEAGECIGRAVEENPRDCQLGELLRGLRLLETRLMWQTSEQTRDTRSSSPRPSKEPARARSNRHGQDALLSSGGNRSRGDRARYTLRRA
jgi:hypothetical protein